MIELEEYNPAKVEQRKAVIKLVNALMAEDLGAGNCLTPEQETDLITGLIQHPSIRVIFALYEKQYAGVVIAFINFSTFAAKQYINVHDLVVLPEFRGRGIGKILLQRMVEIGNELDCAKLTLEVRYTNIIAKKLYASLGFKEGEPPLQYWTKKL